MQDRKTTFPLAIGKSVNKTQGGKTDSFLKPHLSQQWHHKDKTLSLSKPTENKNQKPFMPSQLKKSSTNGAQKIQPLAFSQWMMAHYFP